MALTVSLTLPATTALIDDAVVEVPEITYPTAYARVLVSRAHADKSYICVCWYADEAARFAGTDPVKVFEFVAPTSALVGDYFPAVYSYLKTLPEFEGATDHPFVDPAEVVTPPVDPVVEPEPSPTDVVEPEPVPEPTQPEAQA